VDPQRQALSATSPRSEIPLTFPRNCPPIHILSRGWIPGACYGFWASQKAMFGQEEVSQLVQLIWSVLPHLNTCRARERENFPRGIERDDVGRETTYATKVTMRFNDFELTPLLFSFVFVFSPRHSFVPNFSFFSAPHK
jgi:hypothetical protein